MRRRVFIAIDLPQDVKKRLRFRTEKWRDLPVIWTKEENLHMTLLFLGLVEDESLSEICARLHEYAQNVDSFSLNFEKIGLGPKGGADARMMWLVGEKSEDMNNLVAGIEEAIGERRHEMKAFNAHVTLGRIKQSKWRALPETPDINEPINFSIPIDSIQVFESVESGKGRKYLLLDQMTLK